MRIACAILMIAFVAGCSNAPDLSKKEALAEILDQAIELEKIQYRGKRGEELRYAQNEPAPYTGWVKVMHENGQVHKLFHYRDGKMDGVQAEWNRDGQKSNEWHFKDDIQEGRVTAWWPNGQKMLEGEIRSGKLFSASYWTFAGVGQDDFPPGVGLKGVLRLEATLDRWDDYVEFNRLKNAILQGEVDIEEVIKKAKLYKDDLKALRNDPRVVEKYAREKLGLAGDPIIRFEDPDKEYPN